MSRKEEYIERYRKLHSGEDAFLGANGATIPNKNAQELFSGIQFIRKFMGDMKHIIEREKSISLLDYGCGKGQHLWRPYEQYKNGVLGALGHGIREIRLYDPAVPAFAKPALLSSFQVVTCADVMEHVLEADVPDVLSDIASKLNCSAPRVYLLFSISGIPAFKSFTDGENLHCTLRPMKWWVDAIEHAVKNGATDRHTIVEVIVYHTSEDGVARRQWIIQNED